MKIGNFLLLACTSSLIYSCGVNRENEPVQIKTTDVSNSSQITDSSQSSQDFDLTIANQEQVTIKFKKLFNTLLAYKEKNGSYPIITTPELIEKTNLGWAPADAFKYEIKIISTSLSWVAIACSKKAINSNYDCHRLNSNGLMCTPFDAYTNKAAIHAIFPRNLKVECSQIHHGKSPLLPLFVASTDSPNAGEWIPPWTTEQEEVKNKLNNLYLSMQDYKTTNGSFPIIASGSSPSTFFGKLKVMLPYNARYTYAMMSDGKKFAAMGCSKAPFANGSTDCWRINTKQHLCAPFDAVKNIAAIVDPMGLGQGCEQTSNGVNNTPPLLVLGD